MIYGYNYGDGSGSVTYGEEMSVMNKVEEDCGHDGHVCSKNDSGGKDFVEFP